MIQSIEYTYQQGSNPNNEDTYVLDKNRKIFATIDGATGLGGLPGDLAASIVKRSIENSSSPLLLDMLKESNQALKEETERLTKSKLDQVPKFERSTCGIAAIQLNDENNLNYIAAGDCMIFLELIDGTIRTLTYDHLDRLDAKAIAAFQQLLMEEENALGSPLHSLPKEQIKNIHQKCRKKIYPLLKENRNKLNTLEGYGVVDGSSEALTFLESGTVSLIHVKKILLLTDGLKMHKKQNGWEKSVRFAFENGVEQLFNEIQSFEEQDPACSIHPRLKKHDDKTGILIRLKTC